jgi:hypothetical protein
MIYVFFWGTDYWVIFIEFLSDLNEYNLFDNDQDPIRSRNPLQLSFKLTYGSTTKTILHKYRRGELYLRKSNRINKLFKVDYPTS